MRDIVAKLLAEANLYGGELAELLEGAASEIDLLQDEKGDLRTRAETAEDSAAQWEQTATSLLNRAETAERKAERRKSYIKKWEDAAHWHKGRAEAAERERDEFKECYRLAMVSVNDAYDKGRTDGIQERPPVWPECKPSLSPEEFSKQYHGNWDEVVKREEKERP